MKVSLQRVAKVFGNVRALGATSLEIDGGNTLAVMGPNGAGKSTLLSVLSLTMRPTSGRVLFDDGEVRFGDPSVRSKVGFLSHQPCLYPTMTGVENLKFFGKLYGLGGRLNDEVSSLRDRFSLGTFAEDRQVRVLSRGQLQRVALARTLLSKPELLLLDEPASGLDKEAVEIIGEAVRSHSDSGGIAVVVTHEPELASAVAHRGVFLVKGAVVSDERVQGDASAWRDLYVSAVEGA